TAGSAWVADSTAVGAVVVRFAVSDEDVVETPVVGFTAGTNFNGYYAISGLTVTLTVAGKTALDVGTVMPEISLTTTGTAVAVTKTLTPVTRATDDAPVVGSPTLTVIEGGTVILSQAGLGVSDVDSGDEVVRIQVSGVVHGYFAHSDRSDSAITAFSLADVVAGKIQFTHDGGEGAPVFSVAAKDATGTYQTPVGAIINFTHTNDSGAIAAISGAPKQGETLRAGAVTDVDGYNNDATYQWQMADTLVGVYHNIGGATGRDFLLTQTQVGKFIKVVVSYTDAGHTDEVLTSVATTVVEVLDDVTAPDAVDLDPATNAMQASSLITANKRDLAIGVVFDGDIAIPMAEDIAKIEMVLANQQAGDQLVLGYTVIDANVNIGLTTLDGLENNWLGAYKYTYQHNTLTVVKGDGGVIDKVNVKKIVEAIKLKNTTVSSTADATRTATFAYIDSSNNKGTAAMVSMHLDTSAPTISKIEVEFDDQGMANTLTLTLSESVTGALDVHDFIVRSATFITFIAVTRALVTEVVVNDKIVTLSFEKNFRFQSEKHIVVAYTQNADKSRQLTDSSGNTLDTFSPITVDIIETKAPVHYIHSATGAGASADAIAVSSDLFIKFSEDIKLGTSNADNTDTIIIYKSDGSIFEEIKVNSGLVSVITGNTVVSLRRLKINPTKDFEANQSYYVHIGNKAVVDFQGDYFAGINDNSWSFSTLDVSTSAIWSDGNGNDVAIDGIITPAEYANLSIRGAVTYAGNINEVSIQTILFQSATTRGVVDPENDGGISRIIKNPNVQIEADGTWILGLASIP
ncbi:MAG: hypothetical protein FE834_05680, partial [Gammaproteobacteria bacterium]|nr:hypothetical protein [Gammaproteobacteria bacterium]